MRVALAKAAESLRDELEPLRERVVVVVIAAAGPRRRRAPRAQTRSANANLADLLALLASDPGSVVDRETILRRVWDTTWYGGQKTIDVHVAALRKKLGDPEAIETVRGIGYRLRT